MGLGVGVGVGVGVGIGIGPLARLFAAYLERRRDAAPLQRRAQRRARCGDDQMLLERELRRRQEAHLQGGTGERCGRYKEILGGLGEI